MLKLVSSGNGWAAPLPCPLPARSSRGEGVRASTSTWFFSLSSRRLAALCARRSGGRRGLGRAVVPAIRAASEHRRAPLPNPLPARSSQGEGEDSICRRQFNGRRAGVRRPSSQVLRSLAEPNRHVDAA